MESGERLRSASAGRTPCRAANVGIMRTSVFSVRTVFLILLLYGVAAAQDNVETIRIDSDLVDLKVSVLGFPPNSPPPTLNPKDFAVTEDGVPQEITFFQAADTPFDLVLLLDLSGSNSKKLKMIRNSAKRFVDAARDVDRIAIVTFTDHPALYSSFTLDRKKLKKTIDEMNDAIGGTNFWDSMDWVLRDLIPQGSGLRRSAIVVMTDGVDNPLPNVEGPGSRIPFEELLTRIRNSETIVFSIYLDTEEEEITKHRYTSRAAYA